MNIERTLFWFKDGDEPLTQISDDFFGLGTLLNRLLNEKYDGKKIKFINLDFSTNKTYELYPILPKESSYYYGGHLRYYGTFDYAEFITLSMPERYKFIWGKAHEYIAKSANVIKNDKLKEASDYAYSKGLEMNLNPDYRVVDTKVTIGGEDFRASIWINFKEDAMYSNLTLEKSGNEIFEKEIDKAKNGTEFFLEMYKEIEVEGNNVILKGRKDVDYLPLKIPLPKFNK